MLSIAPHFTQRDCNWTQFKAFAVLKEFVWQMEDGSNCYRIWAYNGPEAFICKIYKEEVPQFIIDSGYTQEQNDIDKSDFETNFKAGSNRKIGSVDITSLPAFASKMLGTKKLYKRVVGIKSDVSVGDNVIDWTQTFPWAKFMEIQFFNCEIGDYVDLEIYDTSTGTYSTIPNYKLNQFGFAANLCKEFYSHKSEFDADIYVGMIIRIIYHSVSAKNIGINFVMNEVK